MDPVADIKARLPIEELVASYCQLQKKGRNFVALCPFHKDTHPSFLVSPDKGIAYCFACQTGGDVFSFYQRIEGVDFKQALRDLGERTGVSIAELSGPVVRKDEKDRLREALQAASQFYREQLSASAKAQAYLAERAVPPEQIEQFALGYAPDSFSQTYEHLLKKGFSRSEIMAAGLGVQRDLHEERIYDRFRHRLIFPIHDGHGQIVGFGGRTLGEDDAKYINSAESPLYHKSSVLFGLHHARDAMREKRAAILVEGYFDLLACHRVGVTHVVATSGTALTEQHAKILKRSAQTVSLCLDADGAGQAAAERAYVLLSRQELAVRSILLPEKDASDLLKSDPDLLRSMLLEGGMPYLDRVLEQLKVLDLSDALRRREALQRLLPLLRALPFAVEREEYAVRSAAVFGTTPAALQEDLRRLPADAPHPAHAAASPLPPASSPFHKTEIALALLALYPSLRTPLLDELIPPAEPFAAALYAALKAAPDLPALTLDQLSLPAAYRERAGFLLLYCEEHGLAEWSESLAVREIRKNCLSANREELRVKQDALARKLIAARAARNATDEAMIQTQYQQILKLRKMAE